MTPRSIRRIWIIAAVFLAIFAVFAADAGSFLIVDAPQPSEVIVVLAGEMDHRIAHALELLNQGYARRVLIDVPAAAKVYGFTEVQLAQSYIDHLPQSAAIAVCPIEGLSTRDESHDVEKCLSHEQGSKVLIVTSDYHTCRALSIFRHELPGEIFSVAAARDPSQFGARWWTHRQWSKTCFDEWLRVTWWFAFERWR
jgi:uncharacterized SAM-binding protein YcdF (DUF218 family)